MVSYEIHLMKKEKKEIQDTKKAQQQELQILQDMCW